jgi:hypothetical protein
VKLLMIVWVEIVLIKILIISLKVKPLLLLRAWGATLANW